MGPNPSGTVALETAAVLEAAGRISSTSGLVEDALKRYGPAIQALAAEALSAGDEHAAAIKGWYDEPATAVNTALPDLGNNFGVIGDNGRSITDAMHGIDRNSANAIQQA